LPSCIIVGQAGSRQSRSPEDWIPACAGMTDDRSVASGRSHRRRRGLLLERPCDPRRTILKAQGSEHAVRVRWLRPRQGLFPDWLRDSGGRISTGAANSRRAPICSYIARERHESCQCAPFEEPLAASAPLIAVGHSSELGFETFVFGPVGGVGEPVGKYGVTIPKGSPRAPLVPWGRDGKPLAPGKIPHDRD
jgi:hypothetical protein